MTTLPSSSISKTKKIDTNASASAFGWAFQSNAAIILGLTHIKELISLKVEGLIEDIELTLENDKFIYAQAKSQENPDDSANILAKLKGSIKTLINASNQGSYTELIYISNIQIPLNEKKPPFLWGIDYSTYLYDELDTRSKKIINDSIVSVSKKYTLDNSNFDIRKFRITSFPFYGSDFQTRHKIVLSHIKEFLNNAKIGESIAQELLEYWQNAFFQNATNKYVVLKKEEFIWPAIVIYSLRILDYTLLETYDKGQVAEITKRYESFINRRIERFEFVTRVMNDFYNYSSNAGSSTKGNAGTKVLLSNFVEECWRNYEEDFINEKIENDIQQALIQITITKILEQRLAVTNIKKAANL